MAASGRRRSGTSRRWWLAAVAVVLVGAVGFGGYVIEYHFHYRPRATVQGRDPRIVVAEQNGWGDAEIWGTVAYDPQTRCLYLDQPARLADDPQRTGDARFGIAWPKGTRPVTRAGRPGVRMDAFLGRFGGTVIVAGDHVWLGGAPGAPPDPPTECAGPDGWVTVAPGGTVVDRPGPRPPGPARR